MKYRGVEIKEICIGVVHDKQDTILSKLRSNLSTRFTFESVADNYGLIRIEHDSDSSDDYILHWLEVIYGWVSTIGGLTPCVDILTKDWFNIDEKEYNNDSVSWYDFISRLERD